MKKLLVFLLLLVLVAGTTATPPPLPRLFLIKQKPVVHPTVIMWTEDGENWSILCTNSIGTTTNVVEVPSRSPQFIGLVPMDGETLAVTGKYLGVQTNSPGFKARLPQ